VSFRSVFIAVIIGTALLVGAFLLNSQRPRIVTEQPTAELIRASGKCAECHANLQYSVVHEYELSRHAKKGINCLECHQPAHGQEPVDHHGFTIAKLLTAADCRSCHEPVYQQFLRSRHAAPSWAAVYGKEAFTAEQVQFSESFHAGSVDRPPNPLTALEGRSATVSGCSSCHAVGKPNPEDGTIGTCGFPDQPGIPALGATRRTSRTPPARSGEQAPRPARHRRTGQTTLKRHLAPLSSNAVDCPQPTLPTVRPGRGRGMAKTPLPPPAAAG
jgi:hypothetical protein